MNLLMFSSRKRLLERVKESYEVASHAGSIERGHTAQALSILRRPCSKQNMPFVQKGQGGTAFLR